MRNILFIISSTLISLSISAQTTSIDSLIDHIDNSQVGISMQYVWYPVMKSYCGDKLIEIGKPATKKLIVILTDTTKGIIAHFVLSKIWNDELTKAGWNLGSRVKPTVDKEDNIEIYLSGLTFYEKNNFVVFAKQEDLNKNKTAWLTFFAATKSSR